MVQAYVCDLVTSVSWTDRELKAFRRVVVEPHSAARVRIEVPVRECTIVDAQGRRVVEPGAFELLVGRSSRTQDLQRAGFTVGTEALPA